MSMLRVLHTPVTSAPNALAIHGECPDAPLGTAVFAVDNINSYICYHAKNFEYRAQRLERMFALRSFLLAGVGGARLGLSARTI